MANAKRIRGTRYSAAKKGRREQPSRKDEDKKQRMGSTMGWVIITGIVHIPHGIIAKTQ